MTLATASKDKTTSSDGNDEPQGNGTNARGSLTIFDNDGQPSAFINAEELTAFRTALASSLLIIRRHRPKEIVCFGTGRQAYWHIRLSLMLNGTALTKVNLVNHRFSDTARGLFKELLSIDASVKKAEGWAHTKFNLITPIHSEYDRISREQIREADFIFCTTPSTRILFDHSILTNPSGRVKGRLIVAVGSYKPHMIELPPELLLQAIKLHGPGPHFRKRAVEGGAVLVDSFAALTETGELIAASEADGGLTANNVVELGEVVLLDELFAAADDESAIDDSADSLLNAVNASLSPASASGRPSLSLVFRGDAGGGTGSGRQSRSQSKSPSHSRHSSFSGLSRKGSKALRGRLGSGVDGGKPKKVSKDDIEMGKWLHKGNVIYKSVGLGLMDLVVGSAVVGIAREKGVGVSIEDF